MNEGTAKGEAMGMRIMSLDSVIKCKSSSTGITVIEFLIPVYEK